MRTLPTIAVTMPIRDDHCFKTWPGSPEEWVVVAAGAVEVVELVLSIVVIDRVGTVVMASIEAARASWAGADADARGLRSWRLLERPRLQRTLGSDGSRSSGCRIGR